MHRIATFVVRKDSKKKTHQNSYGSGAPPFASSASLTSTNVVPLQDTPYGAVVYLPKRESFSQGRKEKEGSRRDE